MGVAQVVICFFLFAGWGQVQLLQNGGFEVHDVDGRPQHWSFSDYKSGARGYLAEPGAFGSASCVAVEAADTKQRGAWQQKVAMGTAQGLRVALSYRTDLKQGTPGAAVRVTWLRQLEGWDFLSDKVEALPSSNQWRQAELSFLAPTGCSAAVIELFNFWAEGTVWFDEVKVSAMTQDDKLALLGAELDKPPSATQYEYAPQDGATLDINPPSFIWVPIGDYRYAVQWARDSSFSPAQTVRGLELSIFTPSRTFDPGEWFWRYGLDLGEKVVWSKPRRFLIRKDAWELPLDIPALLRNLPPIHPRLWVRADELEAWRNSLSNSAALKRLLGEADKIASTDPSTIPEPRPYADEEKPNTQEWVRHWRDMRSQSTTAGHCAWTLGLAYLATGETKYADAGKRWLLHISSWDPAGTTSLKYNDEAGMPLLYSIPRAYDWLYAALSDDERQIVRRAYQTRGEEAFAVLWRMPFHSNPYSSHPGRWINFLGEGATCFYGEIPEAEKWLDYILQCYRAVYPAWGRDDGGWAEGPNYWKWYIHYSLTWMYVARKAFGFPLERKPFFRNTGYFKLYTNPPNSKMSPFGDSACESQPDATDKTIMWHLGELLGQPVFKWYAAQIKGDLSWPLQALFWGADQVPTSPPTDLPDAHFFPAIGLVAMHSALEDPAQDIMVLFKSGPYGSLSHSHCDQNAFYIQAAGEPLFIDSGWYPWYSSPHHDRWTRETKAHNCITFDSGKGQVKRSKNANGHITDFSTSPTFHYAAGDATNAYGGALKRFTRHVLFARPDLIFVFDDLSSEQPRSWEWWLHALQPMEIDEAKQTVTAKSGSAKALCTLLWPEKLSFQQITGFDPPPENGKPDQSHCWATVPAPTTDQHFLAAISVATEGTLPRAATLDKGSNYFAARVPLDQEGYVLASFRVGSGEISAGPLHADANVLAARYDAAGSLVASFAAASRSLKNGDSVLLSSTEPGTYSMRFLDGIVLLTAKASRDFDLTVRLPDRPRWLLINDKEVARQAWRWENGYLLMHLPAGEHTIALACADRVPKPGPAGQVPVTINGRPAGVLTGRRDYEAFTAEGKLATDSIFLASVRLQSAGSHLSPEKATLRINDLSITDWRLSRGDLVSRTPVVVPPAASASLSISAPGPLSLPIRSLAFEHVVMPTVPTRLGAMPEGAVLIEAENFVDEGKGEVRISRGEHADQHGGASLYNNSGDGHWLEWEFEVPQSATYDLFIRAACQMDYSLRELRVDGALPAPGFALIRFPHTGGWGHEANEWWALHVAGASPQLPPLRLSAGRHRLRLTGIDSNHLNLDYFVLRPH
jgi:hypothetical protein